MKNNKDRLPPQSIEAEESVLGSILIDKEALFRVVDSLHPEDFYLGINKKIYETIIALSEGGSPLDILSVSNKLKSNGLLEEVGGQSYLTKLVNSVPSASHVTHYANIVRKKSILRKLIEASYHISQLGYKEEEDDVDILLDEAEKNIFQISQRASTQSFAHLKTSLTEAFERIEKLQHNDEAMRGVATGFNDLDNVLSGFQKSDLIILAARPSMGKSALAMDIARHAATKLKLPVGIFSLEMSQDQIIDRFLAGEARVDLWRLRTGRLSTSGEYNDFTKIQDALGVLAESPIFIDDGLTSSVLQMRAMGRRLQTEHGLGLIIVDYLQLIQPRTSNESLVQQITEISRSLKALARELNVPVLALSQLSRAVEQRGGSPRLSDLRDSGSIEQDADVVLFIHKDKNPESGEHENVTELHIAKHRNGPTGKIQLFFDKHSASFRNLAKQGSGESTPVEAPPEEEETGGTENYLEDIPS